MKKSILPFVIALFLLTGLNQQIYAQTKEDMVTCMKKVLDLEGSNLFFQFDSPKANTAIFSKERDLTRLGITDEDFRDYSKNVRIWGREDLFMRGIREDRYLCRINFDGSENEISILITTFIRKDYDAFYSGAFVLNKQDDEWVIVNQNFNRN